ncbi:unnamed protein product [Polarella glacialis]|uniref:Uncharacterized protein n=1 Tax=Polarella glacialis TaxID=89957 RepID=A0A813K447_POLGL|nr:unnamed protein product [Polarella glacialis]
MTPPPSAGRWAEVQGRMDSLLETVQGFGRRLDSAELIARNSRNAQRGVFDITSTGPFAARLDALAGEVALIAANALEGDDRQQDTETSEDFSLLPEDVDSSLDAKLAPMWSRILGLENSMRSGTVLASCFTALPGPELDRSSQRQNQDLQQGTGTNTADSEADQQSVWSAVGVVGEWEDERGDEFRSADGDRDWENLDDQRQSWEEGWDNGGQENQIDSEMLHAVLAAGLAELRQECFLPLGELEARFDGLESRTGELELDLRQASLLQENSGRTTRLGERFSKLRCSWRNSASPAGASASTRLGLGLGQGALGPAATSGGRGLDRGAEALLRSLAGRVEALEAGLQETASDDPHAPPATKELLRAAQELREDLRNFLATHEGDEEPLERREISRRPTRLAPDLMQIADLTRRFDLAQSRNLTVQGQLQQGVQEVEDQIDALQQQHQLQLQSGQESAMSTTGGTEFQNLRDQVNSLSQYLSELKALPTRSTGIAANARFHLRSADVTQNLDTESLRRLVEELGSRQDEMQKELLESERAAECLKRQFDVTQSQELVLQHRLQESVTDILADLENSRQQQSDLQTALRITQAEAGPKVDVQSELQDLKNQVGVIAGSVFELNTKHSDLAQGIESGSARLQSHVDEVKQLSGSCADVESLRRLVQDMGPQMSGISDLKRQFDVTQSQSLAVQRQLHELASQVSEKLDTPRQQQTEQQSCVTPAEGGPDADLKSELRDLKNSLFELNTKHSELAQGIESGSARLQSHVDEVKQLRGSCADVESLRRLVQDMGPQMSGISDLKKQFDVTQSQSLAVQRQLHELASQVSEKLDTPRKKQTDQQSCVTLAEGGPDADLKSELRDLKNCLFELNTKHSDLAQGIESGSARLQSHVDEVKQLRGSCADVESLTRLVLDMGPQMSGISDLKRQFDVTQSQSLAVQRQLHELASQVSEKLDTPRQHQTEQQSCVTQAEGGPDADLKSELRDLKNSVFELNTKHSDLAQGIESGSARLQSHVDEVKQLRGSCADVESLRRLVQDMGPQMSGISDLKRQFDVTQSQSLAVQRQLHELASKFSEKLDTPRQHQTEQQSCVTQAEAGPDADLKSELRDLKNQVGVIAGSVFELNTKHSDLAQGIESGSARLQSHVNEVKQLRGSCADVESLRRLVQDMGPQMSGISDLKRQFDVTQSQSLAVQRQLHELASRFSEKLDTPRQHQTEQQSCMTLAEGGPDADLKSEVRDLKNQVGVIAGSLFELNTKHCELAQGIESGSAKIQLRTGEGEQMCGSRDLTESVRRTVEDLVSRQEEMHRRLRELEDSAAGKAEIADLLKKFDVTHSQTLAVQRQLHADKTSELLDLRKQVCRGT